MKYWQISPADREHASQVGRYISLDIADKGHILIKVAAVFFTNTDITGQLVTAAISEIEKSGADTFRYQIRGKDIVDGRFTNQKIFESLKECCAIIFASPTYMGGVAAQFKAFADATSELWSEQEWSGKIASGITSGACPNGDQSSTLQYLVTLASQHGMYWVGLESAHGFKDHGVNRLGCQLGVVAQSNSGEANETDLATARHLGQRVVELARKIHQET